MRKGDQHTILSGNLPINAIYLNNILHVVISLFLFLSFSITNTYSQYTSDVNNPGNWTNGTTWLGGSAPGTSNLNPDITIYGKVNLTGNLSTNQSDLHIYDTLIVEGDITLGNNSDLFLYAGAVMIVYGNVSILNKVNIDADGYLIVSGDFDVSGSGHSGGGITSSAEPAPIFIGGTVTLPGGIDYGDYPVMDCSTNDPNSEYSNSDCNYGNTIDVIESPINEIFQSGCTDKPLVTAISSNSPVVTGNTINLSGSGDPGTGSWPLSYTWSGPNSYSSTSQNPSISNATTSMMGYYYFTVINAEGCSSTDSVYVDVTSDNCSQGYDVKSRDNYTGDWANSTSWATAYETWRVIPPPTNPIYGHSIAISGYITVNGDLNITTGSQKVCDTLVITGDLYLESNWLLVESDAILIVLGNVYATNGRITNNGTVIFAGSEFDKPDYTYLIENFSDAVYIFDDTPNYPNDFTITGGQTELSDDLPDIYSFFTSVACGSGVSGGTISADQTICNGDDVAAFTSTALASPSASASYSWWLSTNSNDPTTGTWTEITGATAETYDHGTLAASTYFYRKAITGAGCETNSNVLTITVNEAPTITSTTPNARCDAGIVTLGATASAGTVNWYAASTGGSSLQSGDSYTTPSISTSTSYYIDATNNGCTTSSRTEIIATVNTSPTINIGTDQVCVAAPVTLDAGAGYSNYSWSTGASTQTIDITTGTNTYNVTVTDANTCTGTSNTVTVTINEVPDNPIHHFNY